MTDHRLRLAAALGAVIVVGFSAAILLQPGGHTTTVWIDDLLTLGAALLATAVTCAASWRAAPADRLGWGFLGAGLASWSFGEAAWAWYELGSGHRVPFPSVADAGYLLAVPLVAVGVFCFRSGGRTTRRARAVVDGLVVAASLLLVSWVVVLGPVFRAASGGALGQAVAVAYPVGDVVIATMVVSSLTRTRRFAHNPLVLVGLGVFVMAISDSVYAYLTQNGTYRTGNPIDIGWVVAYVLVGLAAVVPSGADPAADTSDDELPTVTLLVPYTVLAAAFCAALYTVVVRGADDTAMETIAGALGAFVVVRQLLTLLDNRRLNAVLREKVIELGARELELQRLAFQDPLTGLPNRAAFLERVEAAVSARSGTPGPLSVLFVDLDDFKAVNDTLGHDAGDRLLAEAADRLRSRVGHAIAARLGGDEFGVLVEGSGTGPPTVLATEIHEAFRSPFDLGGRQVLVRASIGIAHSDTGGAPGNELLRQADIAMYAAKRRGKGSSQVFGPDIADGATERVLLRSALASALDDDALDLHYQPIVELVSGRVWGVEALSRWTDGERGAIPPAEFIPLSEESGLIHQLGRLVLKHACEEAVGWPGGAAAPIVSVNVSATQLQDAAIVGTVSDALAASGLPPDRLMVEVSEDILLGQLTAHARLAALRELGVRIAIDDFGTGSSSLRHLPRLPVDVIKIDQALVRGIDEGAAGIAVLRAIVELADHLGLDTIAEGIEEIRQADALASVGCRSGQGYWYRRPVPAEGLWPLPSGGVLRPKPTRAGRVPAP